MKITASIVLYNNDPIVLEQIISSFIDHDMNEILLFLVDHSPTNALESKIVMSNNVIYIHNGSNPGFGAGHNYALDKALLSESSYHFIVNPDITLTHEVIPTMVEYMKSDPRIGMLMPEILNDDGSIQYLPKLLPSPFWILRRKLKRFDFNHSTFTNKYELRNISRSTIYNAPLLSGCFTLLNLDAVKHIGGYDEKFFMYFEDFDLSRRMHQKYKTIYFPEVSVYHGYEGGASKSLKLFRIFVTSALIYFNKWGWVFDSERKDINKSTLSQF